MTSKLYRLSLTCALMLGGLWVMPMAAQNTATKTFVLTVRSPLSITTASLPDATLGNAYTVTLQASGGVGPYTWSITAGQLPSGLSLGSSTGTLSGMPTASGAFSLTIQVKDSSGVVSYLQFKGEIKEFLPA